MDLRADEVKSNYCANNMLCWDWMGWMDLWADEVKSTYCANNTKTDVAQSVL